MRRVLRLWRRGRGGLHQHSIVGNRDADTAFAADDFVTKPLYFGRPWFLPMVYSVRYEGPYGSVEHPQRAFWIRRRALVRLTEN